MPNDWSTDKGLTPTRTSAQNLEDNNGQNFWTKYTGSLSVATFKERKAVVSHLRSIADVGDWSSLWSPCHIVAHSTEKDHLDVAILQ